MIFLKKYVIIYIENKKGNKNMINEFNPLLLIDFYKATHSEQYPKGLTRMVSYYTPRMSRLNDTDKVTLFGLQAFIQDYLIDGFNNRKPLFQLCKNCTFRNRFK